MININASQPITTEAEIDKSRPKIIALAVIGMIFSFSFGYFLKLFILESRQDYFFFSLAAFFGFLTFFLLNAFFIKSASRLSLIIFLESLALLAAFFDKLSMTLAAGALLSFLFFLLAWQSGRSELGSALKIRFWRVGKRILPKVIAGLALFIGVAYANVGSFSKDEFFISLPAFEKIISPTIEIKIIQKFLPKFDLTKPVGETIENLAINQIEKNPDFKLLSEAEKKQIIAQTVKKLEENFSGLINAPINLKAKTSEALYQAMTDKFKNLPENVKNFVPAGFGALIFLIIISFALPIRWLASILAYFIYEIFLALGISVIALEGRSREIIILK